MKTIKLVVSLPGPLGSTDFSRHQCEIEKAIEEGHTVTTLQYLHGKVEKEMGYDICACLNAEVCVDFKKELYRPGEYEAEVIGYPRKCRAFLWNTNNRPRGLIVDALDSDDMKFAKEKYNRREGSL